MRTLAIETATEACSVALFEGSALLDAKHVVLGRGHAERLIPMISELPDRGEAARILVSLGPGSFTGVRIGIAAARALGFAWNSEVLGYPTLALVASVARREHPNRPCSVVMKGGHGELFVQDFGGDGLPQSDLSSLKPELALAAVKHALLVGTGTEQLASAGFEGNAAPAHPDARMIFDLPQTLLTKDLSPIYGRAPDAKLPQKGASAN